MKSVNATPHGTELQPQGTCNLQVDCRFYSNRFKPLLLLAGVLLTVGEPALALPKPDDKPEEVLRTEIITGARSPIDGKPMTASEYAQLQTEIQEPGPARPVVGRSIERNLNLLGLRKFLKTFFPFLPIP